MPALWRKRSLKASELLSLTSVTDFLLGGRGERGNTMNNNGKTGRISISGALVKDLPIFPEMFVQNLKHFVAAGLICALGIAQPHTIPGLFF